LRHVRFGAVRAHSLRRVTIMASSNGHQVLAAIQLRFGPSGRRRGRRLLAGRLLRTRAEHRCSCPQNAPSEHRTRDCPKHHLRTFDVRVAPFVSPYRGSQSERRLTKALSVLYAERSLDAGMGDVLTEASRRRQLAGKEAAVRLIVVSTVLLTLVAGVS